MSFLGGFSHDIFISYAHVNNSLRVPDNDNTRWVTAFRKTLQNYLDPKLGRTNSADIWMDLAEIQGNDQLTPEIESAIRGSAFLVVIMSQGYLSADWCRQERELFYDEHGGPELAGNRVFVVHIEKLPQIEWQTPMGIEVTGYPFYEEHPESRVVRTLGDPLLTAQEFKYFDRLRALTDDLACSIKTCKGEDGLKPVVTQNNSIFVAESTPDLFDYHENVCNHLERKGFNILPSSHYKRAPEEFREAALADMRQAKLFVQLLGEFPSSPGPDLLAGYEGLQVDCASELNLPMLRWRPKGLKLDAEEHKAHWDLLFADDVIESGLEDFKREIEERIAKLLAVPDERKHSSNDFEGLVGVAAVDEDDSVTNAITATLDQFSIGYDCIPPDIGLTNAVEEDDYQALLVIFGASSEEWVRTKVRQCRQICMKQRGGAPSCGVYIPEESADRRVPLKFSSSTLSTTSPTSYVDSSTQPLRYRKPMQARPQKYAAPFPGLRPFEPEDHELFFGRSEQIDQMLVRLETNQFLAVVGSSGSGKSSLVRAGLLPMLNLGMLDQAEGPWNFVILRPGSDPFRNLSESVHKSLGADVEPLSVSLTRATLSAGEYGLVQAIKEVGLSEKGSILVLVDQFEEIFRFRHQRRHTLDTSDSAEEAERNTAAAFVQQLLATARQTEIPIYVVITMRSDFIGDCDFFRGLPEAISNSQFLTPRLTRSQMTEAIQGPLTFFDCTAEDALVNRILNETGTELDQLPLMQHALMRTWHAANGRSGIFGAQELKVADYEQAGGLRGALHAHAEEAWAGLTAEQKGIAEKMFRCLSERTVESPLTRRITTVQEVAQVAGSTPGDVAEVVSLFVSSNRNFIVVSPTGLAGIKSTLDIAHEAFLRQWKRIAPWIDAEARSAEGFRQVVEDARKWNYAGDEWLWYGPRLHRALEWRSVEKPTEMWANRYVQNEDDYKIAMDFLDRCEAAHIERTTLKEQEEQEDRRKEEERQKAEEERKLAEEDRQKAKARAKISFLLSSLFGVLTVFSVILGFVATKQRKQAKISADAATTSADAATKSAKAAKLAKEEALAENKKYKEQTRKYEREKGSRFLAIAREGGTPTFPVVQVLAGKAIGFQNYGRPDPAEGPFWEQNPVFLDQDDDAYAEAVEIIQKGLGVPFSTPPVLLWSSSVPLEMVHSKDRSVKSALYFKDGTRIASGGDDGVIRIWDAKTKTSTVKLRCNAPIRGLALDSEEKTIFAALAPESGEETENPGSVQIWDLDSEELVGTLEEHTQTVRAVAFDQSRKILASASYDHTVRIWEKKSKDGKLVWQSGEPLLHASNVWAVAFSPDGKLLATGSGLEGADTLVRIWNTETWKPVSSLEKHTEDVNWVAFSPVGKRLVSASSDDTLCLWDVSKGVLEATLADHKDQILHASFAPDGKSLVSSSYDGTVRLWDLTQIDVDKKILSESEIIQIHQGQVRSANFSEDGQKVVSAGSDGLVKEWIKKSEKDVESVVGHATPVKNVTFNADGMAITSSSKDGKVLIWNSATGQMKNGSIHIPPVFSRSSRGTSILEPRTQEISPNGEIHACGYESGEIKLWNLADGTSRSLQGHEGAIYSLAFSSDGKLLASGSYDDTIRIWQTDDGKQQLKSELRGHDDTVVSVAFSPDNSKLASGSEDSSVIIWDLEDLTRIERMAGHDGAVSCVKFSRDGSRVYSGGTENIRIWSSESGEQIGRLTGHTDPILSLSLHPRDNLLVSAGKDHTARLWDLDIQKEIATLKANDLPVNCVAFSSDGRRIVTGSDDRTVRLWELGDFPKPFARHKESVWAVDYCQNNEMIISGSRNGIVKIWNANTGLELHRLSGHQDAVWTTALDPAGKFAVSGDEDGVIVVWDLLSRKQKHRIQAHGERVSHLEIIDNLILTASSDTTVKLWDAQGGKEVPLSSPIKSKQSGKSLTRDEKTTKTKQSEKLGHKDAVMAVSITKDGKMAASASTDGIIILWDLQEKKQIGKIEGAGIVRSIDFHPDGQWIVSGSTDHVIRRWDVKSKKLIEPELKGHSNTVRFVVVSPDGTSIASGSFDGEIWIWDVSTQTVKHKFRGHSGGVIGLCFSPNGEKLVSCGNDNFVRIWNLDIPKTEESAKLDFSYYLQHGWAKYDEKRRLIWEVPPGKRFEMVNDSFHGSYTAMLQKWQESDGSSDMVIQELLKHSLIDPAWIFWNELPGPKKEAFASDLCKEILLQVTTATQQKPRFTVLEKLSKLWIEYQEQVESVLKDLPELSLESIVIFTGKSEGQHGIEGIAKTSFEILDRKRKSRGASTIENVELAQSIGLILIRLHDHTEAERLFSQAVNATPDKDKALTLTSIARALANLDSRKSQESALDKALKAEELDKSSREALRLVVTLQEKFNQNPEALKNYLQLIELKEAEESDFIAAGNLAAKLGQKAVVEDIFNRGLNVLESSEKIMLAKGWALLKVGDYSSSARVFSEWRNNEDADSSSGEAYLGESAALWKAGEKVAAIRSYLELLGDSSVDIDYTLEESIEKLDQPEDVSKTLLEVFHATPQPRVLKGHTEQVIAVRFSPDGKTMASGAFDHAIKIWDPNTGKQISELKGHTGGITFMDYNADGTLLASASINGEIKIWNVKDGKEDASWEGASNSIYCVRFSSEGKTLISCSDDETIRLWDVNSRKLMSTLTGHEDTIYEVVQTKDGAQIYSISDDDSVRVWNTSDGTGRKIADLSSYSLALSPDGERLYCGTDDSAIAVLNPATGKILGRWEGHEESVWSLSLSPDGAYLASGSVDDSVRLWDVKTGKSVYVFNGHTDNVYSVDFSRDGKTVASASRDNTVRLWPIEKYLNFYIEEQGKQNSDVSESSAQQ